MPETTSLSLTSTALQGTDFVLEDARIGASLGLDVSLESRRRWAEACVAFVRSVGIEVFKVKNLTDSFLPHVQIDRGSLLVDFDQCFPGDILHEAGHVATIPGQFRPLASGDLAGVKEAMRAWLAVNGDGLARYPEDPVARAVLQAGESEATAWQYAAAVEIGMPDHWLFPPKSYDEEGELVLLSLQQNSYLGINGLQAAGWTLQRLNKYRPGPVYPKLAFWLSP